MKRLYQLVCIPCLLSVAVATAPGVRAEEVPAQGPIPFEVFDQDGNGYISEAEFQAEREERLRMREQEGRPMRGAASAPPFSALDADGDGRLSREELTAGQRAQMQQRPGAGMGPGPGQGMGMGMGMGRNMPSFADFDLNGDGFLEEQEFDEARAKRAGERAEQGYAMRNLENAPPFSAIDSDGDGKVSEQEFSEHQAQQRQRMQQ